MASVLLISGKIFQPVKNIPTVQWLNHEFHLPDEAGDITGQYDLDYVPYFYGIAAAVDDPNIPLIALMKAAQIGWTYFLVGCFGKRIDVDPCNMIGMFAKDGDARQFSDEKLVPAIQATPVLRDKIDTSSSRTSGNRANFKKFKRGFLKLVGSNSPGSVKSTSSVGFAVVEEPDDASDNVKQQGDAISLLKERLKRKKNAKFMIGGTPSLKGLSAIEEEIELSDARVLPIECHDCGESHVLDFDNVSWIEIDEDKIQHKIFGRADPDSALYACPHCGITWDDYQRKKNIRGTVHLALDAGDENGGWVATKEFHGVAGFTELNELYVCMPGGTLAALVRDKLNADYAQNNGDESKIIVFTNSKLGRPYEYKDDQADADQLREVAQEYQELIIPQGGLLLTVGIDVQHDRLAVIIRAHGRDAEKWLIYWGELPAEKTCIDKNDAVWQALGDLVFAKFKSVAGWLTEVSAISIDSSDGATSDAVYNWVRTRSKKYRQMLIMAIKGSSAQQDPEIFVTPGRKSVDHKNPKKQTKADRHGVKVYIVGTNKAKDFISGQLKLEAEGYGRFHFYKTVRTDYFEQITSEVKAPHKTIRNRKIWQPKSGVQNEGLDCEVYAEHASRAKRVHLMTPQQWDAVELKLKQSDMFESSVEKVNDSVDTDNNQAVKTEAKNKSKSIAKAAQILNG